MFVGHKIRINFNNTAATETAGLLRAGKERRTKWHIELALLANSTPPPPPPPPPPPWNCHYFVLIASLVTDFSFVLHFNYVGKIYGVIITPDSGALVTLSVVAPCD